MAGLASNGTLYAFRFLALLPRLPGVKQYAGIRLWDGHTGSFIGSIMGFVDNGNIAAQDAASCPPPPSGLPSPSGPHSGHGQPSTSPSPRYASYQLPPPQPPSNPSQVHFACQEFGLLFGAKAAS